jgi:hypothetical protein
LKTAGITEPYTTINLQINTISTCIENYGKIVRGIAHLKN